MTDRKRHSPTPKTPFQLGYRMPAEWEAHEATWLAWPHNRLTWPGIRLHQVEQVYLAMMKEIAVSEKIHLLVRSRREKERVRYLTVQRHVRQKNLLIHPVKASDAWIRDYGPLFIKSRRGQKAWCKWTFNAWGKKYAGHRRDNEIFGAKQTMIPGTCFAVRRVLEGGSIDVNGKGDCLTTEQCLLNSNRNPSCSQKDIERFLRDYLGILRVFWLKGGIAGDDTDGHVDDVARFVGPKTIVAAYEENPKDENYAALRENWERLQNLKRTKFRSLNLIKLPMPSRIIDSGKRLPASYANFYICNQAVLLPVFGDPRDKQAIAILQKLFRTRKVVPIPSRSLVYGHGAIHCVTMHEPA